MAKMSPEVPTNVLLLYRNGVAALAIAAWTFATGRADFDVPSSFWLVTFLGALLGPCLGMLMTFRSYRYWELSRSSMVVTMQPLFVVPLALLFFGKLPVAQELAGGLVILLGALWLVWIHLSAQSGMSLGNWRTLFGLFGPRDGT